MFQISIIFACCKVDMALDANPFNRKAWYDIIKLSYIQFNKQIMFQKSL